MNLPSKIDFQPVQMTVTYQEQVSRRCPQLDWLTRWTDPTKSDSKDGFAGMHKVGTTLHKIHTSPYCYIRTHNSTWKHSAHMPNQLHCSLSLQLSLREEKNIEISVAKKFLNVCYSCYIFFYCHEMPPQKAYSKTDYYPHCRGGTTCVRRQINLMRVSNLSIHRLVEVYVAHLLPPPHSHLAGSEKF